MKDVEYYMEDSTCRIQFVGEFIIIETNYDKFNEREEQENV